MKMIIFPAVAITGFVGVAAAQSLPPGNYAIDGTVTSMSGSSCPLAKKSPVTGLLYYPGVGRDTTQLVLQSTTLQQYITVAYMNAFQSVPANGLNGWSASNPVSPNYSQYKNGTLVGGGTAAILSFSLTAGIADPTGLSFAQGTISINVDSIAPCQETAQVVLERVADFKQAPNK